MSNNDWKSRLGVVFSTNPDYSFEENDPQIQENALDPKDQKLIISIDKRNRGGKQVTVFNGFSGSDSALIELSKALKNRLGTGGSAKEGEIIIQGDFREKILTILKDMGYIKSKRGN